MLVCLLTFTWRSPIWLWPALFPLACLCFSAKQFWIWQMMHFINKCYAFMNTFNYVSHECQSSTEICFLSHLMHQIPPMKALVISWWGESGVLNEAGYYPLQTKHVSWSMTICIFAFKMAKRRLRISQGNCQRIWKRWDMLRWERSESQLSLHFCMRTRQMEIGDQWLSKFWPHSPRIIKVPVFSTLQNYK